MTSSSVGHNGRSDSDDTAAAAATTVANATSQPSATETLGGANSDAISEPLAAANTAGDQPSQSVAAVSPAVAEPARPVTPPTNGNSKGPADQQPAAQSSNSQTPIAQSSQDHTMVDAPVATTPTNNSQPASQQAVSDKSAQQQGSSQQNLTEPLATTMPSTSDTNVPSTPFTPANGSNFDQHAYMMMALAMSGAGNGMSPPPTVTPSQVTLPNPLDTNFSNLGQPNALRQAATDKALESFARVEFADSVFQMTTYAVIIGRDQRALEQARRDEKRAEVHKRRAEENASKGLPPPSPMMNDRSKFSKSYVSEEGGMLGPESDSEESGRPPKRRKTSTAGSSQQENDESQENVISNRQYVSHTPGAAAVDLTSLRPSPWHVPFIGIHSPGPNIASKTKAISREHLKIAYNQDEGVFEAIPLHKNGFFCEDVHYKSDKVVLKCGDRLQIKDIDFRFIINGVEKGRTGAEEFADDHKPKSSKKKQTHGGKEMSFEFEQTHGNGQIQDTSDELSELDGSPAEISDLGADDDDDDDDGDIDIEGDSEIKAEDLPADPETGLPQLPKKRGPGRPPKNGIMSKREQRLLKKQQQEMAKKTLPQAPPMEPPIKRKVGRPRKHPLPENAGDKPEKRKYKPRKPKEEGGEGSDAERRAREKKEKKARPKSPPLELKIEDYTEEQLQKPNKNYGVLIDETLTAAGPDGLTLKQIYKRICQRYPWFYFHTETKGWESSVRHNLIGNEAFKKDETTNLWSRVPGVELDAGKKRKASSPDRNLAAQGYNAYYGYGTPQPHMVPGAPGYPPGQAPQGYQVPAYAGQPGQSPQPRPVQQFAAGAPGQMPPPAAAQPPNASQVPGYGPPPAPARPQMGTTQPGAYSSPYASRPPPPAALPVKTEDGAAQSAAGSAGEQPATGTPGVRPSPSAASSSHQASPANRPSATPPASAPSRPVIEPRLLSAVVGLKNGLVENLKKARNPKAEAIVMSALNRCVGLKKDATENDKMEAICIKGIRQVVDGFTKNRSPTPGGSTTPIEPPPVFEAKVLTSLNGFKDVSIKALKARLGEAKAEAVTLSAIDRVLGFVENSIVPPAAEGETPGNFEGVEQHLMKSIKQLLQGMNQKLQGP